MHMSRIALLGLGSILLFSIVITKLSSTITVNYDFQSYVPNQDANNFAETASLHPDMVIGKSPSRLMWFMQISDIHLSIFNDPDRIRQFREFCNGTVDAIKPEVVLASGDLADAKTVDTVGSYQFREEWEYYYGILQETKIPERTLWLDIRGNHDNFNVPGVNSTTSYFHRYSIQGRRHLRSYMYTIKKGQEKYSFIAVDACLEPGPKRPFNFIGTIAPDQYQLLEKFEAESRSSNATIWFGHYPSSCIISPRPGLRNLMKTGVAYMCGHLHTLANTVPNMYTLQHTGFLELELGDWKDNRMYRVAAFDHGLFSFTDVSYGHWPVVLVTNPKAAEFSLPHKEPLRYIVNSTHIRILVFSNAPLEIVQAKLDSREWMTCEHVEGPLFVAPWNPAHYLTGMHTIQVKARDTSGQSTEITHSFALDGSRKGFRLFPRITLMTDATTVFYSVFITLVIISTMPLLLLKLLHILVRDGRVEKPDFSGMPFCSIVRKLWILATVKKIFYPLILYPIYITIGPWFIGEIIDNHIGAAFAWGTYVKGTILPGAFSYFYGCVQLFWLHLPFTFLLSHCVDYRFCSMCYPESMKDLRRVILHNLPCVLLLTAQALFAYYFWLAYGTMAMCLGPLRTWSVLMCAYLWYSSCTLQAHDFMEARIIWGNKSYYHFTDETNKRQSAHEL